jgi:hydroxyacylglutathione hydrolase
LHLRVYVLCDMQRHGPQPCLSELRWRLCAQTVQAPQVFGGSMLDMVRSLDKVASLPEQTEVYCAHEYTLENLRFAIAVDPHNTALLARYRTEQAKRERGMPTLPSTIAPEKATNPFLRVLEPDIVEAIRTHTGLAVSSSSANFEALRNWKNTF